MVIESLEVLGMWQCVEGGDAPVGMHHRLLCLHITLKNKYISLKKKV